MQSKDIRSRIPLISICAASALMAIGAASLVSTATSDGGAQEVADELATMEKDFTAQRDEAKKGFEAAYKELLVQLPGVDYERLVGDKGKLQALVLDVMDTSASSADTASVGERLGKAHPALGGQDDTWFLQDWLSATSGTVYTLADLHVRPALVESLDYEYTGVASFEAVSGPGGDQIVVFTASTDAKGITGWHGARTEQQDVKRLQKAAAETAKGSSAAQASPTPAKN